MLLRDRSSESALRRTAGDLPCVQRFGQEPRIDSVAIKSAVRLGHDFLVARHSAARNNLLLMSHKIPIDNFGAIAQRNHPCPCGSGLKFKRCCLVQFNRNRADQLHWCHERSSKGRKHHAAQRAESTTDAV